MKNSNRYAIGRELFVLAAPVIGLNVLSVLALAVDTAMCGRLPNANAVLTGLGFASQLVFLLLVTMIGLTVGTIALVSRANGAGDCERVNHVLAQSSQLTIVLGVGVAALGNLFAPQLLAALGASDENMVEALRYLRVVLLGSPFYYLNILYAGVLRGVQNTKIPFLVSLGTNILNFLINYCLILGNFGFPALGVQGAAIGTVVAYFCGMVAMSIILRKELVARIRLSLRPTKIDGTLAKSMFRIGFPASMDMLILNAGFLSIIGMLGRIDQEAVAAHGIGLRIQALAFVPGLSVSQATAAMVGNALGAGDPERARKIARASVVICTTIMSTLALLFILAAYPIVAIFDVARGSDLEAYTVEWMRLLGYGMPIVGSHIAFVGVFQGSGATNTSLRINGIGTLVQIPLSFVLAFPLALGAGGAWLGFPLSFVIKSALSTWAYRTGRWAKLGHKF